MTEDTWTSLRHWGRLYRSDSFSARMFAHRIREAFTEGASLADVARAAQVTPATARKYGTMFAEGVAS